MSHRTYTLPQIREANRLAGHCWFDPGTMRWFGSRVHATTYGPDSRGRVYFVSSEFTSFDRTTRAYSVRVFEPRNGTVSGSSEFNEFPTRARAHAAARKIAAA
jgi:hypothetical protein